MKHWHTVRYLRPGQIFGRLWFNLYQPRPECGSPPARRPATRVWRAPAWRKPSLVGPATFTFLNQAADVSAAAQWDDASRGALWRYNAHYFDDLRSRDYEERRGWHEPLIERWIAENPAGRGSGWAPYPTSLRICNWTTWLVNREGDSSSLGSRMADSLAIQMRWLSRRLETHLLGNHLWANAKALVTGGVFFEGPEADAWRERGLRILTAELKEQILPDGGHFERTPMYHALVLEDVLDLVQVSLVFPGVLPDSLVSQLRAVSARMLRWLRVMSHPDGEISFFNDAAFGVAAPWNVLAGYAGDLGMDVDRAPLASVETLPDSGYVRLENDRATVLCDVAPVGPDYQPAHAHADTLSFELSLDGRRVVVNGGTSTYTPGPERARQRGTAAHSTVEVDDVNSSDVWGAFRVARRARPFDVKSGADASRIWATAAHDGYRHRPGRVIHRRSWWLERMGLTVTDQLEGTCHRAVARFILHPDSAHTLQVDAEPASTIERVPATWHPEFGQSRDTVALEVALSAPRVSTHLRWS